MGLLRLLLALSVVLAHTGAPDQYRLVGGDTAVEAFFIVSGFYMALILTTKYRQTTTFLRNRCLRLFPVYWIVLSATALWSALLLLAGRDGGYPGFGAAVHAGRSMPFIGWIYLFISNIFILGQDLSLYLHLSQQNLAFTADFRREAVPLFAFQLVPQAWSISLELVFYLLVPFLVRWSVIQLCAVIAASVVLQWALFSIGFGHDPWTYRFVPVEIGLFILGVVVYKLSCAEWPSVLMRTARWQLGALFLFVIAYGWLPAPTAKQTFFYLTVAVTIPGVFVLTRDNRLDRYVGELSYPIYLSHLLIIEIIARLRLGVGPGRWMAVVTTIACSALLYQTVQKRVDRRRAAIVSGPSERTSLP